MIKVTENSQRHSKRSLLPIGGQILSGLFGVVTSDEMQQVVSNLKTVSKEVERDKEIVKHLGENMVSLATTTAQNFDMLTARIKENSINNLKLIQRHF